MHLHIHEQPPYIDEHEAFEEDEKYENSPLGPSRIKEVIRSFRTLALSKLAQDL